MELHQLRYFCAVANTGNFTRAAEQEHVAQPSLSQQILKLEDELGAKLFDRLGRKAQLTQFGEAFLLRAQRILRELSEAKCEIQELAGGSKGTLVLGTIPTIAPYFLPSRLAMFSRQYPDIQVSVVEDITTVLLTRLHEGKIDMALVALPISGDGLVCTELMREPLYAVLPEHHPLAKGTTISLRDIQDAPFILLKDGHCFRDTAVAACRRARLRPNVVFESGHFATILAMVSAGMGLSIIPEMALEKRPGCKFLRLSDDRSYRRIGLLYLKNHFQTHSQRALVECLQQEAVARIA
ncbi:MAG TPA: LysR substrate-binding domain-containing protein [Terriglobales bacterium]|nr:LysR substrate-binding domain-containing protein [Terriglobales bacterium]